MGGEPVRHFGLVFSSGVFVAEYVWDLAAFAVVGTGVWALSELGGGPPGMRKEFQKSLCLSEIVLGERAMCAPSREGAVGDW